MMKAANYLSLLFILVFSTRCSQEEPSPLIETRPSALSYLVNSSDSTQMSQSAGAKASFAAVISYGNPAPESFRLMDQGVTLQEYSLSNQPSSIKIEYLIPADTTATQIVLMGELRAGDQKLGEQKFTITVLPTDNEEPEDTDEDPQEEVTQVDSAVLVLQVQGKTSHQLTQQAGMTASFTALVDQRDQRPDKVTVLSDGQLIEEHVVANELSSIPIDYEIPLSTTAAQILLTIELVEGETVLASQDFTINVTPAPTATSIADLISNEAQFSIFELALNQTGLLNDLEDEGPFTVFAPTDEAFETLMDELGIQQNEFLALTYLTDLLRYHILSDNVTSGEFTHEQRIETLLGVDIMVEVSGDAYMANNVAIKAVDRLADNGTVHTVGTVLAPLNEITTYEPVTIAPPLNDENSLTFFSLAEMKTYSKNQVHGSGEDISALIDFGYYYGGTHEATLTSPAAYLQGIYDLSDWSTLNETLIRLAPSSYDFDNPYRGSSPELVKNLYEQSSSGEEPQTIKNLAEGDVFTFRAADGRYGIAKVESIVESSSSDGRITLSVKMENTGD